MTSSDLRTAVLRAVYDLHMAGRLPIWSNTLAASTPDVFAGDKADALAIELALDYLVEKHLIDTRPLSDISPRHLIRSVSAAGIDQVEATYVESSAPNSSSNVQNYFHGPVGAVQTGHGSVAHVSQNVNGNIENLAAALIALHEATSTKPETQEVATLAQFAVTEVRRGQGITEKLKAILMAIAFAVPTVGEAVPAYHALQIAAQAIGHPLPPLPVVPGADS